MANTGDPLEVIMQRLDKIDSMETDLKRLASIESNIQMLQNSVTEFKGSLSITNTELKEAKQEIKELEITSVPSKIK